MRKHYILKTNEGTQYKFWMGNNSLELNIRGIPKIANENLKICYAGKVVLDIKKSNIKYLQVVSKEEYISSEAIDILNLVCYTRNSRLESILNNELSESYL